MNIYTREIAANLKITIGTAQLVQYGMEDDGFDFSESSTRQLISTAKRIYRQILKESMETA